MSRALQRAKAYAAFAQVLEAAENARRLFVQAGESVPDGLVGLLGPDEDEVRVIVPAPQPPKRPDNAAPGSIWVPVQDLLTGTLVLGVLRYVARPMTPKEIAIQARAFGGVVNNEGSIANLGARFELEGLISRTEGWRLLKPDAAPVIGDGHAWGPIRIFSHHEVAAHRRILVRHVLRLHPSGLQPLQLATTLDSCEWLDGVPAGKDLLKLDLETMAKEGLVRRIGNSAKWELTPKESEGAMTGR